MNRNKVEIVMESKTSERPDVFDVMVVFIALCSVKPLDALVTQYYMDC